MNTATNDLSYWFPILEDSGVKVPETRIIRTDVKICSILDGVYPEGFNEFTDELKAACEELGYPAFLRTGQTSNKHDWKASCYISHAEDIASSVANLAEFSEMASILGLPYRTWAVRKFLPLVAAFTAFNGMPVAREFRCFFRDHTALCLHPYWPPASIGGASRIEWPMLLEAMNRLNPHDEATIRAIVAKVAGAFDGAWSIDIAQTLDGEWVCIDMASMEESYHWEGCPNAPAWQQH